ncbi:hypothetical protein ABFY09_09780 [Marinomonas sp. 5E14-1]|uniref:hypothetical protein n=1 Tax=Marinomonas sp. 5E14-1 TaxID=3153922 RepID=UPI003265C584
MTAIESIKRQLKDFAPQKDRKPDWIWDGNTKRFSIPRDQFPTPNLLRFLLQGVCEFTLERPEEKMHWIIPFTYKGESCAISNEKFGLYFYSVKNSEAKPKEVLGKLEKNLKSAEKNILKDFAKQQIKDGNITISNQFNQLDNRYHYFREQAVSNYTPQKIKGDIKSIKETIKLLRLESNASHEGGYNALAMIDAYFSRLEHFLVLALPFSNYDREQGDLTKFVSKNWSGKLKHILNIRESKTKNHYDTLNEIKEKYRNTFAHGGFEKEGQSFFFHLGDIGIVPASISGRKHSVHFNHFPIDKEIFENICSQLDAFDKYLSDSVLQNAWKFALSGLNLAMDDDNLQDMLEAAKNPDMFDAWIERQQDLSDRYTNAEY